MFCFFEYLRLRISGIYLLTTSRGLPWNMANVHHLISNYRFLPMPVEELPTGIGKK
jgi:hypothetical protein